jgi:hypothetical protein
MAVELLLEPRVYIWIEIAKIFVWIQAETEELLKI